MTAQRERRSLLEPVRLEAREGGAAPKIQGYAALFNVETEIRTWFGSFKESIAPGAFKSSLDSGRRVVSLFNHDVNYVLGSTSGGSLSLMEDLRGLWIEVDPPDTQVGRDVVEYIRRGDVQGQSFMFTITKEQWTFSEDPKELDKRTILDVELFEAGPVLFPAYEETSVGLRSDKSDPSAAAYEAAKAEWLERNKPSEPVVIVSPEPYLLKVRCLRAAA
ncbi:MAG: HK97 family phage prohead protease [Gemmataceae bacterium]|nr:HK97 family phage prohead protease [Gemmataceae bacterium]